MANQMQNIARGKVGYYAGLPAANDAFIIVVFEAVEVDDTLNNYDDLDTLIAAAGNTEATATNYARKSLTSGVTYSVDDGANTAKVTIADQSWSTVSGTAFVEMVVCYDADTTGGGDASIVPLTHHDFVVTPNGGSITADFDDANGFWGSA